MKTITETPREIPVVAETDVLVVGGGPGGLAAALAAAREGADTMLIERYGCFGGTITQVGVGSMSWYRSAGTVDVEGIGIEFETRAKEMGATYALPGRARAGSVLLDTEMFKVVADTLVKEAGIRPLLHAKVVDTVMEGDTIKGVILESKSGRQAVLAKRVIDATGDADIAAYAGAPFEKLPKNELMGVTVLFSCIGVDREAFYAYLKANPSTYKDWGETWEVETSGKEDHLPTHFIAEPFARARKEGIIPADMPIVGSFGPVSDTGGSITLNMNYMYGFDSTDTFDLTRAEIEGREQSMYAIKALKAFVPGFENAALKNFGMTLGTRDSRKIIGRGHLTASDVREEGRCEDSIGIFPEFIDGHGVLILPTTGRYFQVPFGVIVPQKVENLLAAGRIIAGDKIAHAATRSMMCCALTGQAAGVAAAVSLEDNVDTSAVDVSRVQAVLKKQGVRLD
ncbi:MAG: FAD-dependent oxidoreductase [Halieaceae bacterium]|jgi:ribulose 1,5-bisphosphate synthetase/thiazole synthase|nr:FAD-dependent oxidoreductase [Halieaceae bacterium]